MWSVGTKNDSLGGVAVASKLDFKYVISIQGGSFKKMHWTDQVPIGL